MKKKVVVLMTVLAILATTSIALAANGGAPRVTTLSGSEVVPPADPDGSGFASIRLNHGQGRVCWNISFEDIADPFAAHIHNVQLHNADFPGGVLRGQLSNPGQSK